MIELDKNFKADYEEYVGDRHPYTIATDIMEKLRGYKPGLWQEAISVVRASDTSSPDYFTVCERMAKKLNLIGPLDFNFSDFLFETVFIHMYHNHLDYLQDFLGTRFNPRDIKCEVAIELGIPVDEVEKINTEHSYSIQLDNPCSWDEYFHNMCLRAGSNSKCHSRKIGAVLVRDKGIISTGYNGPPRGIPTCDQRWLIDKGFIEKYGHHIKKDTVTKGICPRRVIGFPSGQGLEICPAGHAERNALINAARFGIKTKDTILYMSCGIPCTPCMVEIINSGVKEIICSSLDIYDETVSYLMENSDIKIRLFDFLA
jgi:dCMP deaminase